MYFLVLGVQRLVLTGGLKVKQGAALKGVSSSMKWATGELGIVGEGGFIDPGNWTWGGGDDEGSGEAGSGVVEAPPPALRDRRRRSRQARWRRPPRAAGGGRPPARSADLRRCARGARLRAATGVPVLGEASEPQVLRGEGATGSRGRNRRHAARRWSVSRRVAGGSQSASPRSAGHHRRRVARRAIPRRIARRSSPPARR